MKKRTIQTATAVLFTALLSFGMASAAPSDRSKPAAETTTSTESMLMYLNEAEEAQEAEVAEPEPDRLIADTKEKETKDKVGRLPVGAFRLAGVTPGVREEEIRQAFGKPIYGDCETMVFSNGLVAEFDDEHPGVVEELVVAKPGTKARTPAGLTAGMAESEIERQYGMADKKTETPLYTVYTYYSTDGSLQMKFTAKDGVILKIKCEFV